MTPVTRIHPPHVEPLIYCAACGKHTDHLFRSFPKPSLDCLICLQKENNDPHK